MLVRICQPCLCSICSNGSVLYVCECMLLCRRTDRQADRGTERQRDKERQRETKRDKERQIETKRDEDRQTDRRQEEAGMQAETRERERERQTDIHLCH